MGCGRSTTSRTLATLEPAGLVVLDLSPSLTATTSARLPRDSMSVAVCADFHHLPFANHSFDMELAASGQPGHGVSDLPPVASQPLGGFHALAGQAMDDLAFAELSAQMVIAIALVAMQLGRGYADGVSAPIPPSSSPSNNRVHAQSSGAPRVCGRGASGCAAHVVGRGGGTCGDLVAG